MPEAILVLNAGSSSIKFSVYALGVADRLSLDSKGQVEGIGSRPHFVAEDAKGGSLRDEAFEPSGPDGHGEAMRKLGGWLRERLADDRVVAAGHRVVHGGPDFAAPVTVDAAVLARLERLVPLAPLHQPHNLAAIRAIQAHMPGLPQVACFDTAFHRRHPRSPTGSPCRAVSMTKGFGATASTACPTSTSPGRWPRSHPRSQAVAWWSRISAAAPACARSLAAGASTARWASPRWTACPWAPAAARSIPASCCI